MRTSRIFIDETRGLADRPLLHNRQYPEYRRRGRLTIVLPGGSPLVFENARVSGPRATVVLKRHKPLIDFLVNGELAFAEAYLRGDWDTPSLTDLFDFVLANEENCELQRSGNFATRLLRRRRHLMNANSRKGSKRNIAYHYDLGTDFYPRLTKP